MRLPICITDTFVKTFPPPKQEGLSSCLRTQWKSSVSHLLTSCGRISASCFDLVESMVAVPLKVLTYHVTVRMIHSGAIDQFDTRKPNCQTIDCQLIKCQEVDPFD